MARYNKSIVKRIADLVRSDSYTVIELCRIVGISKDTYYRWIKTKSDFSDAIKRAREEFESSLLADCEKSLKRLVNGWSYEETKTVMVESKKTGLNGKPVGKVKERTVTKKTVHPSLGAIIHVQTNLDPDKWKNRQTSSVSIKDDNARRIDEMNEDQLNALIGKLLKEVENETNSYNDQNH